jgi:hypothetical protein
MIKLKNLLAENMRRFATKNLHEDDDLNNNGYPDKTETVTNKKTFMEGDIIYTKGFMSYRTFNILEVRLHKADNANEIYAGTITNVILNTSRPEDLKLNKSRLTRDKKNYIGKDFYSGIMNGRDLTSPIYSSLEDALKN